jgi:dienelactone hydrolase
MRALPVLTREVALQVEGLTLGGNLALPAGVTGLVLFVHGSGSSRHSPRNQFVAAQLQRAGLGTLLMDLLTADEEAQDEITRALRFDISLLARRVLGALDWLRQEPTTRALSYGLFGASTGAAAALVAAAHEPEWIKAVVSRGGRPDLAGDALAQVRAPTLLIVGGADEVVLELNRNASAALRARNEVRIVPGATHLFEEPGALERVAELAAEWFNMFIVAL